MCPEIYQLNASAQPPLLEMPLSPHAPQMQWYAVQTRSNFENRIAHDLRGKGIEAYLPALTEERQWKDRKKTVEMPLFRGYLFVRLTDSLEARWKVLTSSGVVRIVGRGREAEPVPDPEIESIQRLIQTGAPLAPHVYLREGLKVRVRSGALAGVEGMFLRTRTAARLVISIELLSQSLVTEIDADNVEPVDGH